MNCPYCNFEIEETALVCSNCGKGLQPKPQQKSSIASDIMLLIYVCIIFGFAATFLTWHYMGPAYEHYKGLDIATKLEINVGSLISEAALFLPALAIRNKAMKIVSIILAGLAVMSILVKVFV